MLAASGINIITLSLADTEQFGILRMIVKDHVRATDVLRQAGHVVKLNEVVAVEVQDRPGGLASVLEHVEKAGINVEYMYAFTAKHAGQAVLIFRFEDPDKAIRFLQGEGINVLSELDLFGRAE